MKSSWTQAQGFVTPASPSQHHETPFSEELRKLLGQTPFRPFIVRTADGRETRVSHPETMGYEGRVATFIHPSGGVEIFDLFLVSSVLVNVSTEPPSSPAQPEAGDSGE